MNDTDQALPLPKVPPSAYLAAFVNECVTFDGPTAVAKIKLWQAARIIATFCEPFRKLAPVLSAQPEIVRLIVRCEEEIQGHRMGDPSADQQGAFAELVAAIDAVRNREPARSGRAYRDTDDMGLEQ